MRTNNKPVKATFTKQPKQSSLLSRSNGDNLGESNLGKSFSPSSGSKTKPEIHRTVPIVRTPKDYHEAVDTLRYGFDHLATDPARVQLGSHFVPLDADEDTVEFMKQCYLKYYGCRPWALFLAVARYTLGYFMSHTDVIGFLNCGLMHVVSSNQIKALLTAAKANPPLNIKSAVKSPKYGLGRKTPSKKTQMKSDLQKSSKNVSSENDNDNDENDDLENDNDNDNENGINGSDSEKNGNNSKESSPLLQNNQSFGQLLDIGAGSGRITELIAGLFDDVSCTEVSEQMVTSLRSKNFTVYNTADISTMDPSLKFDVIALFNVLDRCSHPLKLLSQIKDKLRNSDSFLVLAVPLPLRPAVETGKKWIKPDEIIAPPGCYCQYTFEKSIQMLIEDVIVKAGYDVRAVSRVPYLSEGDRNRPFYVLDDSILVLSPKKE